MRSRQVGFGCGTILPMRLRLFLAAIFTLCSFALQAQCVPSATHHCITTNVCAPMAVNAYTPNQLTVQEDDTVEFEASTCHPLRQVIRGGKSTTFFSGGLACNGSLPCIKTMDASVIDADGKPQFHFICTNHILDVMRGDIFIMRRLIFASSFED